MLIRSMDKAKIDEINNEVEKNRRENERMYRTPIGAYITFNNPLAAKLASRINDDRHKDRKNGGGDNILFGEQIQI